MSFDEFKKRVNSLAQKYNVYYKPEFKCHGPNYFARVPGVVKIYGSVHSQVCGYRWGDGHFATAPLPEC